jgi:hypothetical protein
MWACAVAIFLPSSGAPIAAIDGCSQPKLPRRTRFAEFGPADIVPHRCEAAMTGVTP